MRRLISVVALGYVGLAVLGLVKESRGDLTCECAEGCWCKRSPLSLFRWVFPFAHSLRVEPRHDA